MGSHPTKPPAGPNDFAALAGAYPHAEVGYLRALQPHTPLSTSPPPIVQGPASKQLHHSLSRKKLSPAPKPDKVATVVDLLTVEGLCGWVTRCCADAGVSDSVAEVVANIRGHRVDGPMVRRLQPQDWQTLCPCIGTRLAILEALKRAQVVPTLGQCFPAPSPAPPSPAGPATGVPAAASLRPAVVPAAPAHPASLPTGHLPNGLVSSLSDLAEAGDDESFIIARFVRPDGAPGKTHVPGRLAQPMSKVATLKSRLLNPNSEAEAGSAGPTNADVVIGIIGDTGTKAPSLPGKPPISEWQQPAPDPVSCEALLFSRSQFSNHRLIDTPLQVDPSLPLWLRGGWCLMYDLVRAVFFAQVFVTFFLRLRQLPMFLVPVVSITLCIHQGWQHAASPSLFTSILVFPLSFAVNAAYRRREEALKYLAAIKSSTLMLYMLMRSWSLSTPGLPPNYTANTAHLIEATFRNFGHYLTSTSERDREVILTNIYQQYNDLFYHVDVLRLCDLAPTLMGSMISNLVAVMTGFERLRIFSDYRTPCTLRSYSRGCTLLINFIMAPYAAYLATEYGWLIGYSMGCLYFWMLLSLNNIQEMLENPFLTFGRRNAEDDINLSLFCGTAELHTPPACPLAAPQ